MPTSASTDPPPRTELLRALAVLAEPPAPEHARVVEALELGGMPSAPEYSDVFLFQLYPYASVHLGAEGMIGGEAEDRVEGFWRALGFDPPPEPDHLAALLGLYVALADRESGLVGAELGLARRSRYALLHEHLAPWVFHFLDRVGELAPGPYGRWAELLGRVLRGEIERTGVDKGEAGATDGIGATSHPAVPGTGAAGERLPLHLRAAPGLSDPRREGADRFLSALLAPVRSGFLLTRADLARIAGALDVGLRAGERRYALEHLLAQDAGGVLGALAEEARRQARMHEERVPWLGVAGRFHAERAEATARLLDELTDG